MDWLRGILEQSLMITSFVFVMMVAIEYVNVQTGGAWQSMLESRRWLQYAIAALLGAIPGCLGTFTVVSLYAHGAVTFGALVAATVATSGDEAFVMFSMFPLRALVLTAILFAVGWAVGPLVDAVASRLRGRDAGRGDKDAHALPLHASDECRCFSPGDIVRQLRAMTFQRALFLGLLAVLLVVLLRHAAAAGEWTWVTATMGAGILFSLFVGATVPDHFLEEHLWAHILRRHLPNVFAWTLGALVAVHLLESSVDLASWVRGNVAAVAAMAALVGLLPESGPHLVFVTLYAQGTIPFSVLLVSSIVQDGHGTLPLLALSKGAFVRVKLVNLIVGALAGALALGLARIL